MVPGSVAGLPAEDWSAIAAWTTTSVAALAGVIALLQLRHARRLREEQAAPYVVVFVELVRTTWIYDLVIKNLGATAAFDVRVVVTPEPRTSSPSGASNPVAIANVIPVLVPGQDWRTFWDLGPSRSKSELPDQHEATVSFHDSHGRAQRVLRYALDWSTEKTRTAATTYTEHDSAKALRQISSTLRGWKGGS